MLTNEQAGQILQDLAPSDPFLQFLRAMVEADAIFNKAEGTFLYFLEKPWKWATEYVAWDNTGRPMDDSEPGWEAFLAALDQ